MKLENPMKVLVRRRAALGDVVISTGIVRELHNRYGENAVIDVATQHPQVFDNNPYIRNVIAISEANDSAVNLKQYDVVYNLDDTYELNPEGHFADNYFYRVFGDTEVDKSMELYIDQNSEAKVDEFVSAIGGKFISMHMRNWYWDLKNIKLEVWLDVVNQLYKEYPDLKIVAVGGETDYCMELPHMVDARALFTPGELCYLMDHAQCFVGIDSAPFHIAGSSETGIVALLSHMYPNKVLPYRNGILGNRCEVVQADVSCVGCHSRQARPVRQIVCERGDFACNRMWDTAKIVDAIKKFL